MRISRRTLMKDLCCLPLCAPAASASALALATMTDTQPTLPDKKSFPIEGTYLDAAYTHPLGMQGYAAGEAYFLSRRDDPNRRWPGNNPRNAAVALFASLINASPSEVAVVPSTMEGENLVGAAVGLGPQAGLVTDAFHYDASLAMYGELQRGGVPVAVVKPRENRIDLDDLEALIQKGTRLVAVSLVSSITGFQHDLKHLCEIAHAKGAMVYADIVQAAGAIPIDVKASGVDFCCCGTYKWLMGDFGTAFLYVRPDRLEQLRRVHYGWRDFSGESQHVYPFDEPGPVIGDWKLGTSTVSHFELGTPDWSALGVAVATLTYIHGLGVEAIQRYRQPMLDHLQRELPQRGFLPLTPEASQGPIVSFALKGAEERLKAGLVKAKVQISVYENRIRISPSVYNDMGDIDRLVGALTL
jgi:selenocysteine lyase/cysteine desulfurase